MNDSQEDSVVRRSEPRKCCALRVHVTHPYSSLNYLGLQHTDFQTKWSGRPIIQLRAEPFEACPHETDPSFDFELEMSAFVGDAAQVIELVRLSIPLASCFDDERWSQGRLARCS